MKKGSMRRILVWTSPTSGWLVSEKKISRYVVFFFFFFGGKTTIELKSMYVRTLQVTKKPSKNRRWRLHANRHCLRYFPCKKDEVLKKFSMLMWSVQQKTKNWSNILLECKGTWPLLGRHLASIGGFIDFLSFVVRVHNDLWQFVFSG